MAELNDLRGAITYYRLSAASWPTHLQHELHQHGVPGLPVQAGAAVFGTHSTNGILIADEVGLGKTIEAGLI
ncbi:MAG: hypothetical protein R3E94_17770 [Burkholderiaceae bacterium]